MRDKFISILKQWPFIHRFVKVCYWKIRSYQEILLGTEIQEKYWQKRHLLKKGDWQENEDWVMGYWDSKVHPHRRFLIERIFRYSPLSILEVGSNCGPNLYLLAKRNPQLKLVGIDINAKAIRVGKRLFGQEGISNVELLVGKTNALHQISDKSFDIVFTDAVLMYVGPDKIKKVVKEMFRISRKALIFLEWHENSEKDPKGLGIYHFGHWKRNHINLLKEFVRENQIHIEKIPEELWPGKYWNQLGYIIEVIL